MLEKIEQMIVDLLPLKSAQGHEPDIEGTASPDIAQLVVMARGGDNKEEALRSLFKNGASEEGWRDLAYDLARALLTIDKEHRAIIEFIRSRRISAS